MKEGLPKVLIVGQYFDLSSGGGITMTNLFKGWDKNKIAVAAENIRNPDTGVCDTYYELGFRENKRRFPFHMWQEKKSSGIKISPGKTQSQTPQISSVVSKKMKLYNQFLHYSGLYNYSRKLNISPELREWVKNFAPDVIYTQLSSLDLIDFVWDLHKEFGIPFIIHIMDDWPSTVSKKGLLQNYWHKKIDKKFRRLLNNAKGLMSISDAMSDEYQLRYGKEFVAFHNPITADNWVKYSKTNYQANNPFVLLYAGRIGTGIQECFFELADAINELVKKGRNIELHIQSTSHSHVIEELKIFPFVQIKEPVAYSELPLLFASVDVLLLPNDFDAASVSFLRYSMPTKASEYMATGTPILLYASPETAIAKHADKNRWAVIVSENRRDKLVEAIEQLYTDEKLRQSTGTIAKEYSVNNYDDVTIRRKFRDMFLKETQYSLQLKNDDVIII